MLAGRLQTVFGWVVHATPGADPKTGNSRVNPRSMRKFPMQATGAEMMRLACCLATERGITVCAAVHDALLVEGPSPEIEGVVVETRRAMEESSRVVLSWFSVLVDAKAVSYPDRFRDCRGKK